MAEKKDANEKKNDESVRKIIKDLIFEGQSVQTIEYKNKKWTFKTLTPKEMNKTLAISNINKDYEAYSLTYKLEILKSAIVAINDIEVSNEAKEMFDNLPIKIIDELYDEYLKISKVLVCTQDDFEVIRDISKNDDTAILKFTVMKEFGALPTEQRVKDLNEHQWVWLYNSIVHERNERAKDRIDELDYLAFFVNPELHNKVKEAKKNKGEKKGLFSKSGVEIVEEHDEENPYNPNVVTHYGNTTVDDDFEAKLKLFVNENEATTELDSDTQKGDSSESQEDFITRALRMQKVVEQENLKKLEKDAKEAGVNPDDLDGFEIN